MVDKPSEVGDSRFEDWVKGEFKQHGWVAVEGKKACFHDACPSCKGTGRKEDGEICVHHISCPCPKCSQRNHLCGGY